MSTTPKLESMLTDKIGRIVDRHILPIFKFGAKVTVLVRHPGFDDADVVVTSDDDTGVHAIVERRFAATPSALSAAPNGEAEPAEPVAWFAFADSNGPVPLELYGWDKKGCLHAVLQNARAVGWKGTVNGYLFEQNWTVRPVYLAAPQSPTPEAVLVDAERLTDEQLDNVMRVCISIAERYAFVGDAAFPRGREKLRATLSAGKGGM